MKELFVSEEVLKKAKKIIQEHQDNWPEDDWFGLSGDTEDFDLNLYDMGYGRYATIYPAGDTSVWINLEVI